MDKLKKAGTTALYIVLAPIAIVVLWIALSLLFFIAVFIPYAILYLIDPRLADSFGTMIKGM